MRALVLLVILAVGGWYLLSPDGRALLDRLRINWTRWENQSHYRSGQPLPGTWLRVSKSMGSKGMQRPPQIVVEPPMRRWRYLSGGLCRRSSLTSPA